MIAVQVHVRISPKNDAEEHLMALPATAALLEVLGLHISGVNDPSVWDFDGSVMDLNDKLLSLTVRFLWSHAAGQISSTI